MPAPIDRRFFLSSAAASTAALAAGSAGAFERRSDEEPKLVAKGSPMPGAMRADVLVVGAGASGVPAAIAAARGGAKVILLEEDQQPGGAPVDMYVASLCGFPRVGVFQEMLRKLDQFAAGKWPHANNWYMPVTYVQAILELLEAEPNLQLVLGATVNGVFVSEASRNRVRGVSYQRSDGSRQTVEAAVTIDATGTGLVAALAGCQYMYGRSARGEFGEPIGPETADSKVLPCTLMTISQRMEPAATSKPAKPEMNLNQAVRVQCDDTRDPVCLAQGYREALRLIAPQIRRLGERGHLVHIAPKLGVREVRRVVGETVLTVNDLRSGSRPDDTVATGNYFIDAVGEKEHDDRPIPPFAIPYRALLPKDTEGLLLAGKAISGTHLAHSAYRVQPIMAAIGQASGTAAALAVEHKTAIRSLPLAELQGRLKQAGVLN